MATQNTLNEKEGQSNLQQSVYILPPTDLSVSEWRADKPRDTIYVIFPPFIVCQLVSLFTQSTFYLHWV